MMMVEKTTIARSWGKWITINIKRTAAIGHANAELGISLTNMGVSIFQCWEFLKSKQYFSFISSWKFQKQKTLAAILTHHFWHAKTFVDAILDLWVNICIIYIATLYRTVVHFHWLLHTATGLGTGKHTARRHKTFKLKVLRCKIHIRGLQF